MYFNFIICPFSKTPDATPDATPKVTPEVTPKLSDANRRLNE